MQARNSSSPRILPSSRTAIMTWHHNVCGPFRLAPPATRARTTGRPGSPNPGCPWTCPWRPCNCHHAPSFVLPLPCAPFPSGRPLTIAKSHSHVALLAVELRNVTLGGHCPTSMSVTRGDLLRPPPLCAPTNEPRATPPARGAIVPLEHLLEALPRPPQTLQLIIMLARMVSNASSSRCCALNSSAAEGVPQLMRLVKSEGARGMARG